MPGVGAGMLRTPYVKKKKHKKQPFKKKTKELMGVMGVVFSLLNSSNQWKWVQ